MKSPDCNACEVVVRRLAIASSVALQNDFIELPLIPNVLAKVPVPIIIGVAPSLFRPQNLARYNKRKIYLFFSLRARNLLGKVFVGESPAKQRAVFSEQPLA